MAPPSTGGAVGTGGGKGAGGGKGSGGSTVVLDGSVDGALSDASPDGDVSPDSGASPEAGALGTCSKLPGKVVYIESGDTQENLLKNVGRHLRDHGDITLAFFLTGSCTLISDAYKGGNVVKSGTMKYIPSTAEDGAWNAVFHSEATCTTGTAGVPLDLAISALFVDSCPADQRHLRASGSLRGQFKRTRSSILRRPRPSKRSGPEEAF